MSLTLEKTREEIRTSLKNNFNIDLDHIVNEPNASGKQKRALALEISRKAVAEKYGLTMDQLMAHRAELMGTADDGDGPESIPNAFLNQDAYDAYIKLSGQGVEDGVSEYANRLKLISDNDGSAVAMATVMGAGGIIAFGAVMLRGIIVTLKATPTLTYVQAAAKFLTTTAARVAVVLIIVELLTELFLWLANLTREFVGLVINSSDNEYTIENWQAGAQGSSGDGIYVKHGEVTASMNETVGGFQLNAKSTLEDGSACYPLGMFQGEKNFGFLGIEAYTQFTSDALPSGTSYVIMYSNPYGAISGINASIPATAITDQEEFYDNLYENRATSVSLTRKTDGWTGGIQGELNSVHGETAYGIFVLS